MKPLFLSFALLLVFFGTTANASIFIGNGGEGVKVGDRIFLRDLFEAGIHEKPVIGEASNPMILSRVLQSQALRGLGLPAPLVARKLTDLQALSTHFGVYILSVINSYQWVLVDTPLNGFEDDGSALQPIHERVPLANRFQFFIRIHRPSWNILSEEHRLALVIHEALFGILRPEKNENGYFFQHGYQARDLVAFIFSGSSASADYVMPGLMEQRLSLPRRHGRECFRPGFALRAVGSTLDENGVETYVHTQAAFERNKKFTREELLHLSKKFCQDIFGNKDIRVTVQMKRDPWWVKGYQYQTVRSGQSYGQLALRVVGQRGARVAFLKENWSELSRTACQKKLFEDALCWFHPDNCAHYEVEAVRDARKRAGK